MSNFSVFSRLTDVDEQFVAAARKGWLEEAQRLTQALESTVHAAKDRRGWTALQAAASDNRVAMLRWLLAQPGVDVDRSHASSNATALYCAAERGHVAAVQLLIDAGADVNVPFVNGRTPLQVATKHSHANVVAALTAARAHGSGADALFVLTAARGDDDALALLQRMRRRVSSVDVYDAREWSALAVAAVRGNVSVVRWLLRDARADVDAVDSFGRTALYRCCETEDTAALAGLTLLLDAGGADVDRASHGGTRPLHLAVSRGVALVGALCDAGADVNGANRDGRTALDACFDEGRTDAAALLLAHGADTSRLLTRELGFPFQRDVLAASRDPCLQRLARQLAAVEYRNQSVYRERARVLVQARSAQLRSQRASRVYAAALVVFRALRSTRLGAHVMQRIAEALAALTNHGEFTEDEPMPLSSVEVSRLCLASRVSFSVRTQRAAQLAALDNDYQRIEWLRLKAPVYKHHQLAPLGPRQQTKQEQ